MIRLNRIKRILVVLASGTLLASGFAVAGLLGAALVLIPGVVGILAMESARAKRWLFKDRSFLVKTNPPAKKNTV